MSKSTISRETVHRLIRDVKQIMKSPLHDNGIFYEHDEADMLKGYAMIIGPEDTPYYGGYYMFELTFPSNYPHSPPVLTYLTNGDNIRFNPNLYKTGKVCISILNTWRGDQWTSCQNISSVLLSLCMVLCKDPMLNEPGITEKHRDFQKYNSIIEYKNIEIAMLHLLNKKSGYYLEKFNRFYPEMKNHFHANKDKISQYIHSLVTANKSKVRVQTSIYSMDTVLQYDTLIAYLKTTTEGLAESCEELTQEDISK